MAEEEKALEHGAPTRPIFLEPQSYRRRRLIDAARVLPVLGVILWMIPLLWPTGNSTSAQPVAMSSAILYIFLVWLGMILVAICIWLKTRSNSSENSNDLAQNGPDGLD
ncbi:MAG: hypothetical protein KC451_14905 [Amylibacter sp.]|nr:hypothetical protein [Amylibacter sp.]